MERSGFRVGDEGTIVSKEAGPVIRRRVVRDPFCSDDGGFTSLSVVVAMMLVLALVFSAAQVRWVQSESPDIQFAADAGALAGENVVAEFYVIARVVDSMLLSMSLMSITMLGISIVLCCIPATITAGTELMNMSRSVSSARDKFAAAATEALDTLQGALPFLAAANSASVISANSSVMGDHSMVGLSILVPLEGGEVALDDGSDVQEAQESIEESNAELSESTEAAAEIAEEMESVKQQAYMYDCGYYPEACMRERASTLAGLSGASNPHYSSVDSWSFSVALERAKSYYPARLSAEAPNSSSLEEKVRSACRERFYAYACEQMEQGYVREAEDGSFEAYFPTLPANTSEMRQTSLFTDASWPVSSDGVIHGTSECPAYVSAGSSGTGSLSELEGGTWEECAQCEFNSTDMGRVGSASSSIDNGFEYHYRKVAALAEEYEKLSQEYVEETERARESAQSSLDSYSDALEIVSSRDKRYDPSPPGRSGCIAVVVDLEEHVAPGVLSSLFVDGEARIGARMAISASALAKEEPKDGDNIISTAMESLYEDALNSGSGAQLEGALDWLAGIWGGALQFYSDGVTGLRDGLEEVIGTIPGLGDSPLGSWAANGLMAILDALDLEPVDLSTPRPVTVNTIHVLDASGSDLSAVMSAARGILQLDELPESLTIEGFFGGDIEIALPDFSNPEETVLDFAGELLGGGG